MQIKFTLNITEVIDEDQNSMEDIDDDHYDLAARAFASENKDVEHELVTDAGIVIHFEMQDIEVVKDG